MADPHLTPHFLLEVTNQGRQEGIKAILEPLPETSDHSTIAAEFAQLVRQRIGISVEVEIVAPGTVERSTGKAVRVRDLRHG